jgi:hypothetical protein
MKGGTGINFEFQSYIDLEDMARIGCYNTGLTRKFLIKFKTFIFTRKAPAAKALAIKFSECEVINLREVDADKLLEEIRGQIKEARPMNKMGLALLPLCNSKDKSVEQLFEHSVEITVEAYQNDYQRKTDMLILGLLLIGKEVDEFNFARLKEEIIVILQETQLYKWIEERSKQEGILEGLQKGKQEGILEGELKGKRETARNALRKNMAIDDIVDLTGLPREEIEALNAFNN